MLGKYFNIQQYAIIYYMVNITVAYRPKQKLDKDLVIKTESDLLVGEEKLKFDDVTIPKDSLKPVETKAELKDEKQLLKSGDPLVIKYKAGTGKDVVEQFAQKVIFDPKGATYASIDI